MTRNIFLFLGTFVAGALIALVVRAAMFAPHVGHEGHPAAGGDYAGMVSNPLAPANVQPREAATASSTARSAAAHENHSGAATKAVTAKTAPGKPVNSVCAICGMDVDPKMPTAQYQGQTIGFGCKMCRPKFEAEPDRYGPSYLKNEVIKR
ncbi:MAG: hypothetical protein Q7S40_24695 [Opitutaceae bacterium]|nr:hypothetical protein [Opitutaceae bacterium]